MAGASIVVDIKAQITGYQQEIEKIKAELKKVDPGSLIGKSLNKTLEQASRKLEQLTNKSEQRISSQSQLTSLFDQLYQMNDLMRSLGQGMQNVGLNDVFIGASDKAKELGQQMKEVQDAMKSTGKTFIDDLMNGTKGDKLRAIFEDLKFDPKTMGINEFVEGFKNATKSAEQDLKSLKDAQKDAAEELARMESIEKTRSNLPVDMRMGKPNRDAISNYLGINNLLDKKSEYVSRNEVVQNFLSQLQAGLANDKTHTTEEKGAISGILNNITEQLLQAQNEKEIENILKSLQDQLIKGTKNPATAGIAKLTNMPINDWINKINDSTALTEDFRAKVEEIKELTKDTNTGKQNLIGDALNNLLQPASTEEFQSRLRTLVMAMQTGMQEINAAAKGFNIEGARTWLQDLSKQIEGQEQKLANYSDIAKTQEYQDLLAKVTQFETELQYIKEQLGLEKDKMAGAATGGIHDAGKKTLEKADNFGPEAQQQLKNYSTALEDVQRRQQMMGKVEGIAQRWFSVYAAVRMVGKAFRSMKENITKIDDTITEIAIVTDMSQSDLWRQMPQYTDMARKYGSSIEGVYQVSQLYYQQGLEQEDVMALTEQTLKMARISGLDYADATNYMTNAIRSFKMEMQDAQTVVDVYSALAASSASSTTELATAMSKTASSAAAVGASFESTSAMMAVMIETTRESPENIGSALKSIISRYGELKENKTGIDEEGEEYSLNKVDTALQSVGISIHDAQGQFRDFDEVIMELAQSWDTIDTNTQRYIATVMAGNRQQSRFLALVSNGERLAELTETAENSEDASTLQVLKTMDSIAYKSQNLQTSLQSLYTDSGIENFYKGILDGANQIVKTFTDMPTLFQLPIPALASFAMNFISIANVVLTAIQVLKNKFTAQWDIDDAKNRIKRQANNAEEIAAEQKKEEEKTKIRQQGAQQRQAIDNQEQTNKNKKPKLTTSSKWILGAQVAGSVMNMAAGLISDKGTGNRAAKAGLGIGGSMLQYGAMGAMFSPGNPLIGAGIGAAIGGLMGVWQNISYIWESTADQAKRLKEEAEVSQTEYQQKKAVASNAEKEIANVKKLAEAQYDSAEAREKYIEASNKIAQDMPELVGYYDNEGNAILDLSNAYAILAQKRREANEAATQSAQDSLEAANKAIEEKQETIQQIIGSSTSKILNDDDFTGQLKGKWEALEQLAPNFDLGHGQQLFNVKWGNATVRDVMQYANESSFSNSPALQQLYSMLKVDDTKGIQKLLTDKETKEATFNELKKELNNITDPFDKAVADFVIAQLESVSTELNTAFGNLYGAEAERKAVIQSNAAEYISGFIADTNIMAEYGERGDKKDAAKATQEILKKLDNSSEILTSFLTNEFLTGTYNSWDDFVTILNDPEKSPLVQMMNVLKQVPKTAYEEVNNLLKNKSRYSKIQMQEKLGAILNKDTVDAIIGTYSNYYNNLITGEEFKEQINKQGSITDFKTSKLFDEKGNSILSGEEMSTILDMQDRIESMYETGRITAADAKDFMNAYSELWGTGDEAIQQILSRITDFSSEGLEELYSMIDNSDEFISDESKESLKQSLATLFGFIPQNLNTSLKSYEEQMVNTTKEYSKDMTSATKGMDYEAASELSKKLGIDTSTQYFDTKDGELFLKNTQLIYDHYFGENGISTLLTSKMQKYSDNLKQHIEGLNKLDLKKVDEEALTQDQAEKFGVDLVTLKQVIKDFKESGLDAITDEWITSYFQGQITNTEELVNKLIGSDNLNRAIESGKIKDIVKAAASGPAKSVIDGITGQLETALKTGDFKYLIENSDLSTEFKSKLPELKTNYDNAQSSVIDDLISGINEGFSYIEGTGFNQELLTDLDAKGLVQLTEAVDGISSAIVTAKAESLLAYLETIKNPSALGMTSDDLNEKIASLRQDIYEKSENGVLQSVLKNYENLDEITYKNFMKKYSMSDETRQAIFGSQRADGSYKVNLANLSNALKNSTLRIDELTQEQIDDVMTQAIDDRTKLIADATSYTTKGVTSQSDINKFKIAAQSLGMTISEGAFSYDSILNAWTLDPATLTEYAQKQAQELIDAGLLQQEELTNYLDTNVRQTLAQQINISDFLKADNKGASGKSYQTLKVSLTNYFKSSDELLTRLTDEYINNVANNAPENIKSDIRRSLGSNASSVIADYYINQIKQGGTQAVEIIKAVSEASGQELSASDIEDAYRADVNEVENALDQILYGPGSLVSGRAVAILQKLQDEGKASITKIGDGSSAVITSITDIAAAYEAYYQELAATGEATLAALNEAKAKVLETKNGRAEEQQAINALGDASGMTYSAFAEIFTNAGIELTDTLMQQLETDQIIDAMGGNKMRIKDFAKFAQAMNWDFNSEEYISAFKTYNDSLIDLNNKVSRNIVEEVTKLKDAKPGDWINLTEFSHALQNVVTSTVKKYDYTGENARQEIDITALDELNQTLQQYGAHIQNGILKLADSANLLEIAEAIQSAASNAELDLQNGLQEIADTIQDILTSYVEAIQNGIKGGLNNVDAANLQQKALDLGINNVNFVKTAEGLKLSEQSAIALYSALKKVDAMQASLVFNDLKESIESTNENFQSTSSILGYINVLNQQINAEDSNVTNARLQQYESELSVAKEILAVRMTSEDSSMNFMSNALPAAQQNPLNYYKNWSQAFNALNNAKREKAYSHKDNKWHRDLIDYQDWYNIVNEMSNIAAASGELITLGKDIEGNALVLDGSLEKASELIQKGADSLVQADTGELKVSLRDMGVNFEAGSGAMSTGIEAGIRNIADSQIHMLDGIIRVLEMIVAMEQLGDVTGEDMSIDLGDIFAVEGEDATEETISQIDGFTKRFEESRKNLLNTIAGTDAETAFKHTKISLLGQQHSMLDLFSKEFKDLFPQDLPQSKRESAMKAYQGMLDSFYKAAISGDYDINNIAESVQNIIKQNGIDLSDFVFEFTDKDNKITRMMKFVGETLIDIDFEDKDTRTNFDKYFGTTYANDEDGYREHIQKLLEEYQTKEEKGTLTLEESIRIRTELGVASNEFVLKKNKDNSFTGYYNGKEFTGSNAKDLLQLMAEAALLKDQGFDFNTEVIVDKATGKKSTVLKGTTTIGGIEVGVKLNKKGKPIYTYVDKNNHPHNSQDPKELMGYMAADGELAELDAGTYSFDKGGKTYNIEVKEHSALNLKYTITTDSNGTSVFTFNGQDFNSYEAMYEYMAIVADYDPLGTKSSIVINKDGTKTNTITVNEKLDAQVIINYDSRGIEGPPIYSIGGKTIPGNNAKAVFDTITAIIEKNGGEFDTNQDYSGKELQAAYYYLNQKINVKIDLETGESTYSWEEGGENISGNDPTFVEAAIAAKKGLKDSSKELPTVTMDLNQKTKVKFKLVNGKVELDSGTNENGEPKELTEEEKAAAEELRQKLQEQVDGTEPQTLENPVEAKASSIIVKTEGAEVTTDVETLELPDIPQATTKATNLKVEIGNIEIGELPETPEPQLKPIEGTLNLKEHVIEKLTQQEKTEEGQLNWENKPIPLTPEQLQATGVITWENKVTPPNTETETETTSSSGTATGTVGLAKAQGTLMGELGPELVVSKGRYFVAGQNGPEMVDLADDAIVFNHLQTKSLLEKGTSPGRGKAITNERNAIAYAKGSIHGGPAMSSASAALAALKQLRAQWAALANLSAQDLAGAGGGGGGGGGDDKAFIKELERWYNLLQEIATLEAKISRETQIQAKIKSSQYKNGKQYFNSQARTLKDLQAEIKAQQTLNTQQQAYFNKRRKELNEDSPFSSLYTFDENGQLKYKEGAFEKLSKISGRDSSGKPNMTPEQQYKAILKMNPEFKKYMQYDSSGNKIKDGDYAAMVQAFWDKIEADKQEMQSLKDSINETGDKILELQTQQNEILQEMKDNQMAVENAVLDAIVDAAQREIDELQDTRDAIEDSNSKFISGLQDALDKERQMYENQEKENDLNSKLRQLAILQASGGPASEIASLQKEVDTAQRDVYFDKQQEQIDAIQEASDRQIEKLDQQIKLMQDTLDYEKAHGLLWNEVKEIMDRSPEEIAAFIHNNNSEYWDDSPVASEQALRDTLFMADQWVEYRKMTDEDLKAIITALGGEVENAESQWNNFDQIMTEKYGDKWTNSANREKYKQQFLDKYNETGDYSQASAAVLDSEEFAEENLPDNEDRKEKKWLVKQRQDGSWYVKEGTKKSKNRHKYDTADKRVKANNKIWEDEGRPAKNSKKDKKLKNNKKYKYDIGGMVSETGEALLHAKEAVLTPRQTHILRNDLLGSGKNSLATLLTDFRDAYQNLQTGDRVVTNNSGLTIGNASVNMNVQKIANDYDAQRAGEQALSKMVEIARKTKAQNRIGG